MLGVKLVMATSMLRARQALRIIDRFERATAESRRATQELAAAEAQGQDVDRESRGLNDSIPEETLVAHSEQDYSPNGRTLQRPPSHTTVDIPELTSRDSAKVRRAPRQTLLTARRAASSAAVTAQDWACSCKADCNWHDILVTTCQCLGLL